VLQRYIDEPAETDNKLFHRIIFRALLNDPELILADEPTGNLDTASAKELHQLFFDLRKQFGQTFLIVTHNEELARMSDRVLHMRDGKIV
jgi:lipoprotein-releasing system ATP-binding protein